MLSRYLSAPTRFVVGDRVSWTKYLTGGMSVRVGVVVEVVPPGEFPGEFWPGAQPARDHESYVVRQNENGPLLWPVGPLRSATAKRTLYAVNRRRPKGAM